VIDQARLHPQGALALTRKANEFSVDAVKSKGLDRPWSPAIPNEIENDTTLVARPSAPRPQDATPSETDLQAED
jgi:competence protein ComEC